MESSDELARRKGERGEASIESRRDFMGCRNKLGTEAFLALTGNCRDAGRSTDFSRLAQARRGEVHSRSVDCIKGL